MHRAFIKQLGGPSFVAFVLGLNSSAVNNWCLKGRQIPWKWRYALAAMAKKQKIALPDGFLDTGK